MSADFDLDRHLRACSTGVDARSAVADMDATVAALPGLEGLTVSADAVAAAARRHDPVVDAGFVADPDGGLARAG